MKSSNFINESVFRVNLNYVRLQNQTKELFFKCLNEGRDVDYFKTKLEELWNKVNYDYMNEQIIKYEEIIHEYNLQGKKVEIIPKKGVFALIPISVILAVDKKFQKVKEKEYKKSMESYAYKNDKEEYLKLKVSKYNNQIVPYYSKTTGKLIRYVQPSTYNSMIHNTNLTRSGWNTTLNDGDSLNNNYYIIPFHNFSCEHCLEHQNKIMTKEEVIRLVGTAEETEGDILHPNCKCVLTFYNKELSYNKPQYDEGELEEQYQIRQKINTLTLRKEEILNDMNIQKNLGNQDEFDELNKKRNKINSSIRELKEMLPTEELQKQVIAINR